MNIYLYDSLNEKVRLCNNCLKGLNGELTKTERAEILKERNEQKNFRRSFKRIERGFKKK